MRLPVVLTDRRKYVLDNLKRFRNLGELRRSRFYSDFSSEIESLLSTPELIPCNRAVPRLSSFVRVAQWNVEKGKQFGPLLRLLETDEMLRWADIVLLNEADNGMVRSGNRHVARTLAEALGMNMAYAAACLELTKGTDEEPSLPGENRESLQGNAVLSRYPMLEACVVRLPQCFEPYEFQEKRYGGRNCLWVRLRIGHVTLWVGSTHLEVRNTPGCRARQMKRLVAALPGSPGEPHLLGGDLNSNGLRRGSRWRTMSVAARLVLSRPARMKERLLHPECTEPLFKLARRAGFALEGLNSAEATACAALESVEDAGMLPAILENFVRRRLAPYQGHLCLKIDWFMGKGVRALRGGEMTDCAAGVESAHPGCIQTQRIGSERISDHSPIYADLSVSL